jgi:F-box interacting protein
MSIPEDLIPEILSHLFRLPVKSLVRLQCVSNSWFALINEPRFIKMHLESNSERTLLVQTWNCKADRPLNYYLVNLSDESRPVKIFPPFYNPDRFSEIVGCCDGLVCTRTYDDETVIWNPSVRKYKKLPSLLTVRAPGLPPNFEYGFNFAFGCDPVNDDYKVLRIVEYFESSDEEFAGAFEVKVYSLKAHCWTSAQDKWPYSESRISSAGPVFVNGALHWLVKTATRGIALLAFHLATEKFQEHRLPVEPQSVKTLEVLGGSLCVSAYGPDAQSQSIEFWMMKERSCWSRLCTVPTFHYEKPLKAWRVLFSTTDGQKVLMEMDYGCKNLFWYDIKNNTRNIFLTHIRNKRWIGTCVGSLLLLHGDSVI